MSKITQAIYTSLSVGATTATGIQPVKVDVSSLYGYNAANIHIKVVTGTAPVTPNNFIRLHFALCQFVLPTDVDSSSSSSSSSSTAPTISDCSVAPAQLEKANRYFNLYVPATAATTKYYVTELMSVTGDNLYCWLDTSGLGVDVELSATIVSAYNA